MNTDTLLTPSQVQAIAQIGETTLYRWINEGKIPQPIKLGKLTRWPASTINTWISGGCKPVDSQGESP